MLTKTPIDAKIAAIIGPTVADMGFHLVRLRLMSGRRPTLQIMAERPDGTMEVEDCAKLSRALSAVLDVEDPIDGEYVLEVSSPGIDRPLTRPADFANYSGHLARLETAEVMHGRKRFKGFLKGIESVDGETIIHLDAEQAGEVTIPFSALTEAKLVLTDELIAESLRKGAARADLDPAEFDEILEDDRPDEGLEDEGTEDMTADRKDA